MIGRLPMRDLVPLEYTTALDVAAVHVVARTFVRVVCAIAPLLAEAEQRLPVDRASVLTATPAAALWVEPERRTWRAALAALSADLPVGSPLMIIASRPLAQGIPERRSWSGQPLGLHPGGLLRLRRGLVTNGFRIEAEYGVHTALSIAINAVGHRFEQRGRPDVADRFQFAARLRYTSRGFFAPLATVALYIVRKERG